MKPTFHKVYGIPAIGRAKRRNVDMKIDSQYLVPVESKYTKEQLTRITNAVHLTKQIKERENRWME